MEKTLYIGLGGYGGRIIAQLKRIVCSYGADDQKDCAFACLDRDLCDCQHLERKLPW